MLRLKPGLEWCGVSLENLSLPNTPQRVTSDYEGVGLPVFGTREISSYVRVRPGDTVLVGGLESESEFGERRNFAPFRPVPLLNDLTSSRRSSKGRTSLLALVTARVSNESLPKQ